MRRVFFILILVAFTGGMSGCAVSHVYSTRSLSLPPEKVARGGSVCVISSSKIHGNYPSPSEAKEIAIAENEFRAKGFKIATLPPGADYGFIWVHGAKRSDVSSATVIRNEVLLSRPVMHEMIGEFYSLNANGTSKQRLWEGHAYMGLAGPNFESIRRQMLEMILRKFPN